MNEFQKRKFESLLDSVDFFPLDAVTVAQKFGYKIVETDQFDLNTIGFKMEGSLAYQDKRKTEHYTGKAIVLNKQYPSEVKRFCIVYFLSKDYLGYKEDEVYSCISILNNEAFCLAQKLLIPEEIINREFNLSKEEDFETAKVLSKKLAVPMNLICEKKGKKL